MKKKLTIREIDENNHRERLRRGFVNRQHERQSLHPRRKFNCRKLTLGRLAYRQETAI